MSRKKAAPDSHPVLALPFVRDSSCAERKAGAPNRIFWDVKPSGDYEADCETGERYANLALDYMARENFSALMRWAVFDMIRAGKEHSGIEVGFLGLFDSYALAMYRQPHIWGRAARLDKAPKHSSQSASPKRQKGK
jgi:hypothetical protein